MKKLACVALFICSAFVHGFAQDLKTIEHKLVTHLANLEKWSNYGDKPDYDKAEKENDLFKKDLLRFGRLAPTLSYTFPLLKGKMFVATSKDGTFRIFSWDRQTGGTMHDFDSVFQYRGKSGRVYTWTRTGDEEDGAGSFYMQIFQVSTPEGPVYLANYTGVGSTSLGFQGIELYAVEGEKLNTKVKLIRTNSGLTNTVSFEYDFFSVVDHPERPVKLFLFDEAKRSFRFPVVIEDSTTPQGRVTKRFITYRFTGSYFVKVS